MYHVISLTGTVASSIKSTEDETFFLVKSVKSYKDRAGATKVATAQCIVHVPEKYGKALEPRLGAGLRVSVRGVLLGNEIGNPFIREDEKRGVWTCFDIKSVSVKILAKETEGMESEDEFFGVFVGNLGRDPEMRYLPDATAVTNFSMALNTGHRSKETNEFVKETIWMRCAVWGTQAESAAKFLHKGSKCLVEGALVFDPETGAPRLYDRNDGSAGSSFEVTVFSYKLMDKKGEGPAPDFQGDTSYQGDGEEEIPF